MRHASPRWATKIGEDLVRGRGRYIKYLHRHGGVLLVVTAQEMLDSGDHIMGNLTKSKGGIESFVEELPTISRPCMKKAGVAITPRRMPSSTSS